LPHSPWRQTVGTGHLYQSSTNPFPYKMMITS
jgi:hypothetical protein